MQIRIIDYQSTSAAGHNIPELRQAILNKRSGLRRNDLTGSDIETWIGRVPGIDNIELGEWQSRNNALASFCLAQGSIQTTIDQAIEKFSASRIGLVMGSSTSSIDRTEQAYTELTDDGELQSHYHQPRVHNPHAPGLFVAHSTGITGPSMTINTACSSSAKVFATASRWLRTGLVDAVLVGGVDTLCLSVIHGFDSLQLVSKNQCKPFDQHRDGINLGEAAGFALLCRSDEFGDDIGFHVSGYGESSDAHHMSHPHPDGLGAEQALQQALTTAKLETSDIDYINLHGTATQANDHIEGHMISRLFDQQTICSSTKAWTGHTLGAAGITESLIALDAAVTGTIPASMNLEQPEDGLTLSITQDNISQPLTHVMSNSFGFGGNNCCVIFSRVEA